MVDLPAMLGPAICHQLLCQTAAPLLMPLSAEPHVNSTNATAKSPDMTDFHRLRSKHLESRGTTADCRRVNNPYADHAATAHLVREDITY